MDFEEKKIWLKGGEGRLGIKKESAKPQAVIELEPQRKNAECLSKSKAGNRKRKDSGRKKTSLDTVQVRKPQKFLQKVGAATKRKRKERKQMVLPEKDLF